MTPQEFLDIVVQPTLHEAEADPLSLRRTIHIVAVVDMLAAHIYEAKKDKGSLCFANGKAVQDDTGFRELLAERSSSFRLLRDIAKAQKHVRLTKGNNRKVTNADQVKATSLGYGLGGYGEGPYGGTEQIVVKADNGSFWNVLALVNEAVAFLEGELPQQLGKAEDTGAFPFP